ncbi:MAG: leucine-rich repeat protein, partial [Clostridia bacterium]
MNLKKTSNKIIITALIAVLMICAAPLSQMVGFDFATAIEAEAADSLTWEVSSTTLTISGTGAMEDYSASSKAPWSSSSAVIKTVVIQDGVTSIGDYAFYWFTSLTSVTMADSVESIGDQAFYNCTSLKTLTIGDGVTTIGTDAFAVCTALTTVTLGDSVEVIDAGAFSWCSALTTITIPASTTLIGENAFYSCDSLKTVNYAVNSDAWAKVSVHSNGNSALGSASFTYGYYVDAPVITSVVVVDYETITINWDLVGYAEGYRVYGLIDGTYANIKTVSGSTSSTYTITDLNPNTEYTFAVRAYDRDADSVAIFGDYSEAYVVSTATAQPVISSTSSTDTTATFSWKAVDGADGYRVYKVVDGVYSSMETISASTLTYTVEGLDYETEYSYAVNAYVRNFDGVAYFLTMSEVATISTTEKILLPSYVEEITVTNGSTWLTLDWEADEGATGYQVYMNGVKIDTLYDSETTYTVTDLDGATDYEFSLRSFSKATGSTVWGTYSDTYTFTTNPFKAKFSSNSSTATSITINWSKTDGADGYRVYMQINGTYTSLETVSASTYSYTISDLDPDTEYSFKVKAYTRDVES